MKHCYGQIVRLRRAGTAILICCSLAIGQQSPNEQVKELYDAGDSKRAIEAARNAVQKNESTFGTNSRETAISLNNLAVLLRNVGDLKSAEALLVRAVQLFRKTSPLFDVASALTNLGTVLEAEGRGREAEFYYRESLAIWRRNVGPGHPAVAGVLARLGHLYNGQGRFQEAEALLREALAINESTLGPVEITTARTLWDLAQTSRALGNIDAANLYSARSSEILKRIAAQCGSGDAPTCRDADALRKEIKADEPIKSRR